MTPPLLLLLFDGVVHVHLRVVMYKHKAQGPAQRFSAQPPFV